MENLTIRPMGAKDLKEVLEIERASLPTCWTLDSYERLVRSPGNICIVAETGKDIAGYVTGFFILESGDIYNLAVSQKFRRRGIGKKLLIEAISRCKDNGVINIFIEARRSNTRAYNLYKSAGFLPVSIRKNYYTNPVEDAITMVNSIKQ